MATLSDEYALGPNAGPVPPSPINKDLSTQEILQLIAQIRNGMAADEQAAGASGVARDANANYREMSNKTQGYADLYGKLMETLSTRMNESPEVGADYIRNRADQIFSSYSGSVDRANAIASSQLGAKMFKNGMGDSSASDDARQGLTRQYSDVYNALQEKARQRAFDEIKARNTQDTANYNAAAQGLNGTLRMALDNSQKYAAAAGTAASAANTARGASFEKILDTGVSSRVMGGIDSAVKDAGGYGALLKSLKDGLFGNGQSSQYALGPNAGPNPPAAEPQYEDWSSQYQAPVQTQEDAQAWNQVQPDDSWMDESWSTPQTSFEQAYDY